MTGETTMGAAPKTIIISEKDFLFGSYKWCREHAGNQELLALVRARLQEYEDADMKTDFLDKGTGKKSKRDIREDLVARVLGTGGRFLQVADKEGTSITAFSKKEAIDKMSEVFKNCKRSVQREKKKKKTEKKQKIKEVSKTMVSKPVTPPVIKPEVLSAVGPMVAPSGFVEESKFNDDEDLRWALDGLISLGTTSRTSKSKSADYADMMSVGSTPLSWAVMSSVLNEPLSVEDRYSVMSYSRQASSYNPGSLLQMSLVETLSSSTKPSTVESSSGAGAPALVRWTETCPIKEISTAPREVTDEIEAQLQRMKDNMNNETVVLDAMKTLLPYTESYENDAIVASAGGLDESGIDVFMRAMKTFPLNEKLQECGCVALGYLAKNLENKVAIANNTPDHGGGIEVITTAMKRFRENTTLQVGCFLALGNLSMDGENGSEIARSGGIQAVVDAMKHFNYDGVIQSHGCFALSCLASDPQNKDEIARADGISTILLAMGRSAPSERIQQHGCFALGSLALDANNADFIVRAGAIFAVTNAMTNFPDDEYVQSNAIFALANFACKSDSNRNDIASANGVTLVMNAMRRFPNSEEIQRYAAYALGNFAEGNLNNADYIGQNGGVDLVIEALKRFANKSDDVVSSGCWALESLSEKTMENRKRIAELQGVELARASKKMLSKNAKRWLEDAISTLHDRFLFSNDVDDDIMNEQQLAPFFAPDDRAIAVGPSPCSVR